MNSEKLNQIIDEVYGNYTKKATGLNLWKKEHSDLIIAEGPVYNAYPRLFLKEEFINKIKTDQEFSEKWGLKIEERELYMEERWGIAGLTPNMTEFDYCNKLCDEHKVPTKLITITYNDIKTEVYE